MQISKEIFLSSLSIMKKTLDLQKYKLGKDSDEFVYYKSQIMEITYNGLKKLFRLMVEEKLIIRCPNKCNLKKGYSDCKCSGSGYINLKNKKEV